jgi:small glutamine-rich tetratricopeptide repeat-containing protein alpha
MSSTTTNLFLSKRTDLLSLDHLTKRCTEISSDPETVKQCKLALETLSRALNVNPSSAQDKYRYGLDASLAELIVAGSETFGSNSVKLSASASTEESVEQSARFLKYLEVVKKKGAFGDLVEGTPAYNETMEKVKQAYVQKFEPKKEKLSSEDAEKAAEAAKLQGNDKLQALDYAGAIQCYDQALEHSSEGPNSHIFLSNRAAAYTHLKDYEKAAADCSAAIALKPDFSKAHSRLAQALFSMGQLEEATKSAQRAVDLDAGNTVAVQLLEKIRSSAPSSAATTRAAPRGGRPAGGMPQMPPGMPDMSSIMNNPMFASMMQDPQMMAMAQQMASDPNAMANLMNMMGGAGGGRQ